MNGRTATVKVALLSAGVQPDNAGDSFIEDAIRRIVSAREYVRFPLVAPLTDADLAGINECDCAIICGTNLYQQRFNCNLSAEIVERIKPPIIPLGIGTSATIGSIPRMNAEGIRAVRAIHRRCPVSSVRDAASLRFLRSIGVKNAKLTGCPVFFHGLCPPEFTLRDEGELAVSVRARLLHIESGHENRQIETLRTLCRRYGATLVIQSPYDREIAGQLAREFKVPVVQSAEWQVDPYLATVQSQRATAGFRLHYGMLSLSYGKPAYFIAHDSRVSEFCDLVGISYFDIRKYSDAELCFHIDNGLIDTARVTSKWRELAAEMRACLAANGLSDRLEGVPVRATSVQRGVASVGWVEPCEAHPHATRWASLRSTHPTLLSLVRSKPRRRRPRVLFLVDRPRWAYDHSARQIQRQLRDEWDIEIRYVVDQPIVERPKYDLLYVFFWGEKSHLEFGFDPRETIKELSSHRWLDSPTWGPCTPREMAERYLWDADTIACTSMRLKKTIDAILPHVTHAPNGIDERHFRPIGPRRGALTIGWAGDARDSLKGVGDVLIPACEGKFRFLKAPGSISHRRMNRFYNRLDVFAVASRHEGEPLTLIESMAAGCFPVCCDVGIVPELVRHRENGWIVAERTPEAFREAFTWCAENLEQVRMAGLKNAETVGRERSWSAMSTFYRVLLGDAHRRAGEPRFRNDDVSWDTDLARFREFCGIFQRRGLTQVHGITLFGRTAVAFEHDGGPCEYQGLPNLAVLPNTRIRDLSADLPISRRTDLVEYLRTSPDEIALHGLYHTDYSRMSPAEQEADIRAGLAELKRLFPEKRVRYFIPPFNRISAQTVEICRAHRLHVLGTDGIHLEEELHRLRLAEGQWHRYHHHRFYPESKFGLYGLSLTALDAALARAVAPACEPSHSNIRGPHWLTRVARMFSRAGGF